MNEVPLSRSRSENPVRNDHKHNQPLTLDQQYYAKSSTEINVFDIINENSSACHIHAWPIKSLEDTTQLYHSWAEFFYTFQHKITLLCDRNRIIDLLTPPL